MDSLVCGLKENTDASKVALEINGSRYAYNISLEKMQEIVFLVSVKALITINWVTKRVCLNFILEL